MEVPVGYSERMPLVASLCTAAGLALVHLFAGKLRFLGGIPRSRWLSMAGGVSVAYVFVHLLPELSEHQDVLAGAVTQALSFLERHVYLVALLGLSTFYGLERLARASRRYRRDAGGPDRTSSTVFWLHIASFGLYNALIGYLLHRVRPGDASLLFFFLAMALHFVVNDYGLREHHKALYTDYGRRLLAAAVFLGWGIGLLVTLSVVMLAVLMAFLAGGVILNVLKEELPQERESRFGAFAFGAAGYAMLLLLQ
ncbi:MAG: hypothetical protein AB1671_02600 [Thermodesulfobacteriota bacterium]